MCTGKRTLNNQEKKTPKRPRMDHVAPKASYKKTAIELAMEETEEYERRKETEQRRSFSVPGIILTKHPEERFAAT